MPSSCQTSLSENPFNIVLRINQNGTTVKAFFSKAGRVIGP
jgi:hypothetical protein